MGLIRFLLAVGVILCHTSPISGFMPVSGDTAVQCFYIISGFYMSLILRTKYKTADTNSLFYTNRLLKIYPIYWITLILGIVWGIIVFNKGLPGVINHYYNNWPLGLDTWCYLIFSNIFLVSLDWIFLFSINSEGHLFFVSNFNAYEPHLHNFAINSIAWTVGLELMFYLIAPFILRKNWRFSAGLLIGSLILRLSFVNLGKDIPPYNYMFFPTQIMFFMGGALSYAFYEKLNFRKISRRYFISIYILLLIIVLLYNYLPWGEYINQSILYILTALSIPFVFHLFKSSKVDRFFGDMSYPMYITQALVIQITAAKAFPKIISWGFTAVIIVFLFSLVLHYFIQVRIEKFRQNRALLKLAVVQISKGS